VGDYSARRLDHARVERCRCGAVDGGGGCTCWLGSWTCVPGLWWADKCVKVCGCCCSVWPGQVRSGQVRILVCRWKPFRAQRKVASFVRGREQRVYEWRVACVDVRTDKWVVMDRARFCTDGGGCAERFDNQVRPAGRGSEHTGCLTLRCEMGECQSRPFHDFSAQDPIEERSQLPQHSGD
jgi:hypothetical protein